MSVPQSFYDVMRLKRAAPDAPKPTGWEWRTTQEMGAYQLRKDDKYEGVLYLSVDSVPAMETILDRLVAFLDEVAA